MGEEGEGWDRGARRVGASLALAYGAGTRAQDGHCPVVFRQLDS